MNKKKITIISCPKVEDSLRKTASFVDKAYPFVQKGTVYGFGQEELVEPTIKRCESSICSLITSSSGLPFGLTTGHRSHLFYFALSYYMVDLGIVSEETVMGGAIIETEPNIITGGWYGKKRGGIFAFDATHIRGTASENFKGNKGQIKPLNIKPSLGNHGIINLVYHKTEKKVFALTFPGNKLVSLNIKSMQMTVEFEFDDKISPALVVLPDGSLLGAGKEGRLWQYFPDKKQLVFLDAYVPCQMGKRYASGLQCLLVTRNNLIYGGTCTDGFFFLFDYLNKQVINLGKPNRQSVIRALTEGNDGIIYGIVEEPEGVAHLFSFNPQTRGFFDYGIINSYAPVYWTAHSVGCLCTGNNGEIYLGETDAISHLFVYYPPIPLNNNDSV